MSTSLDDILVGPDISILQAMQCIDKGSAQIVLVVESDGKLIGTLTDGDVRRAILAGKSLDKPVATIMNTAPLTFVEGGSQEAAIALMRKVIIHQLPVLDADGRVVGLITLDSALRSLQEDTLVVLMAGGLGSRLRPLTETTPKPLLPIGGRPLLEITIDGLAQQGFSRFLMCVNYKAEMFREHFGHGQRLGVDIDYVQEHEQLGTAGALRLLPDKPKTPVLVMNGDILTNLDARRLLQFHREQQAAATMCVREYQWQVPYGVVKMTENGRISEFEEKPFRREFVNAGIYVLSPQAFDHLPPTGSIDMPALLRKVEREIEAPSIYLLREYWLDIGHLDDFQRAQNEYPQLLE